MLTYNSFPTYRILPGIGRVLLSASSSQSVLEAAKKLGIVGIVSVDETVEVVEEQQVISVEETVENVGEVEMKISKKSRKDGGDETEQSS